jgi:hypothetical protein
MVRDAVLKSAFTGLFAFVRGMVRVRVRPDCHQNSHQSMSGELDTVGLPSNTLGGGNAPFCGRARTGA